MALLTSHCSTESKMDRLLAHDTLPFIPHEMRKSADFTQTAQGWQMVLIGPHKPNAYAYTINQFRALGIDIDDEGFLLKPEPALG